jgi:hypothetical protein
MRAAPIKNYSRLRYLSLLSLMIFFCGCNPNQVKAVPTQVDGEDAVPSRLPGKDELLKVTAPGYKAPEGAKSECFGRLVFDVAQELQWPTFYYSNHLDGVFDSAFSVNVADPGDRMRFGNTLIAVVGSVSGVKKERLLESTPAALEQHLKKRIKETRAYVAELKAKGGNAEKIMREINEGEEWIRGWEETIKEGQENFEPFDLGQPNSEGYWTSRIEANDEAERYSVIRAYLTRGDHVYVFESSSKMEKPSDKDVHKKNFAGLLAKFRTRAPNEIPTELGVCVPFGFMPDDGKTVVEFKQSLRFPDAPGVLYTIETGNVHARRLKLTPMLAAAHASINPSPTGAKDGIKPVVTQRIGPQLAKIGGLPASQGGVVLKVDQLGREKYEMYSVFTGYGGWLGTSVLPYILVEMHTVIKAQASELEQNPPPFKPSMDRLDLLLKSMRWRPTTPPMPELEHN